MEPDALLALIAGGGGGVLVLGAGAWAYIRSRGRKRSGDETPPSGSTTDAAETGTESPRTATAVKERPTTQDRTGTQDRPAPPTWADTLSAPAPKSADKAQTPADGETAATDGATTTEGATSTGPGTEDSAAPTTGETSPPTEDPAAAPDTDEPFDQETAPETGVVEGPSAAPAAAAGTVPADETTAPADSAPAETTAPADSAPAETTAPVDEAQKTAPVDEAQMTAPVDEAQMTAPVEDAETAEAPPTAAPGPAIETPEAPADRMVRLRERLARSGALGRGILTLLTRGSGVDEDTWDEIEETLLLADLGPDATDEMLENLRERIKVLGTDDAEAVREVLREELVALVNPDLDRRLAATRREAPDGTEVPSVLLMVGVNGTGKTTTVGKLARVLVAAERSVVLGAADTFRAAAAEQLTTWGARVGVDTVRSDREGADPAAVAFDAVKEGIRQEVDVVIIDTAGRLQNKKGLMDELGKVRRVAEKGLHGDEVAEVLLVIDATTGQNGMQQARVFSEAVNITGIVLTKLDGTAKGGIVVNVQRELGVPVKMVGLGEGVDDLTPFDPYGFVDALLEG
ncbi:signal recognition particle-docking protein FtsY [Brachybacterium vulturis]|uniref:signal recognition particle-docking protein FtsY n=1 Tax=Brachybacterium vulturis TaxID=2017484 RepID=UPI0037362069